MKNILLLLAILPFMISCQNKEEVFIENYDLEFITEKLKPDDYKMQLLKDSISLQTEKNNGLAEVIVHKMQTPNGKKFEWKQQNFYSEYYDKYVGKLYHINFGSIHFISYSDQLVGLIASTKTANNDDITETINYLTKKYGKPVDLVEAQGRKSIVEQEFKLYWKNKDKLIGIVMEDGAGINKDDKGVIPITTYHIYVINNNIKQNLEKEKIELADFFSTTETADSYYFKMILEDIKSKQK